MINGYLYPIVRVVVFLLMRFCFIESGVIQYYKPFDKIDMQLKFRVIERKTHIPNKNGKKVVYAATRVKRGVTTAEDIADLVTDKTTFNKGEVLGIINILGDEILRALKMGQSVNLHGLGSFTLDIQSESVERREDFTHRKVKGVKVRFTPDKRIKKELSRLTFGDIDSVQ